MFFFLHLEYFALNAIYFWGCIDNNITIDSRDGLGPKRWQANAMSISDQDLLRHVASLGHSELIQEQLWLTLRGRLIIMTPSRQYRQLYYWDKDRRIFTTGTSHIRKDRIHNWDWAPILTIHAYNSECEWNVPASLHRHIKKTRHCMCVISIYSLSIGLL